MHLQHQHQGHQDHLMQQEENQCEHCLLSLCLHMWE